MLGMLNLILQCRLKQIEFNPTPQYYVPHYKPANQSRAMQLEFMGMDIYFCVFLTSSHLCAVTCSCTWDGLALHSVQLLCRPLPGVWLNKSETGVPEGHMLPDAQPASADQSSSHAESGQQKALSCCKESFLCFIWTYQWKNLNLYFLMNLSSVTLA